jgi:hypothetical protein
MTRHHFAQAALVVGEGLKRRYGKLLDVTLDVTVAPAGGPVTPGVRSPFLNGKVRAEGTFVEVCRPSSSLLAPGREAVVRLAHEGRWSLVSVVVLSLGPISSPARGVRHYRWLFLVTGRPCDALHLFPDACPDGELGLEGLLDLLGAGRDDLGRTSDGLAVRFDGEGGFRPGG